MSDDLPDPYLAETGYDEDADAVGYEDDDFDFEADDADDELEIEEVRAREL